MTPAANWIDSAFLGTSARRYGMLCWMHAAHLDMNWIRVELVEVALFEECQLSTRNKNKDDVTSQRPPAEAIPLTAWSRWQWGGNSGSFGGRGEADDGLLFWMELMQMIFRICGCGLNVEWRRARRRFHTPDSAELMGSRWRCILPKEWCVHSL
jgi:hypothetical protein